MILALKVSFFVNKSRCNSKGLAPIFCQILYSSIDRKQFTTGFYVNPNKWLKSAQIVNSIEDEDKVINLKLSEIESKIKKIEKQLIDEEAEVTLDAILNRYKGKEEQVTLCGLFGKRLDHMTKLEGKEYKLSTIIKCREVYGHIKDYLSVNYTSSDIPINQLNYDFIKSYEQYLLCKNLKSITINKIIQRLRQVVIYAVRCGHITRDPFVDYKPLKEIKQLVFLSKEELQKLENYTFSQQRLEDVKNIYLFSVYTGLAYNEAMELQPKHIVKGFDKRDWIVITRLKTQHEVSVPLLDKARMILDSFADRMDEFGGYYLPRVTNQKVNSYIKEIADIVGIEKKLTHHTARKTFASTILLYNDVPIEIVSKLLGHSDIAVTQRSYAQVVQKSISNHMEKLSELLK